MPPRPISPSIWYRPASFSRNRPSCSGMKLRTWEGDVKRRALAGEDATRQREQQRRPTTIDQRLPTERPPPQTPTAAVSRSIVARRSSTDGLQSTDSQRSTDRRRSKNKLRAEN